MGFYSKHNKYVSTPDWFGSISTQLVLPTVQQTMSTIVSSGSVVTESTSVQTSVNLHNKFVVEYVDVTSDILTISDTAIVAVAIESDTAENIVSVGTLLSVSGWKTSDFIAIAANTTLTITATLHSNYGIVFYDNTQTPINGITISTIPQSITIPENAFYFRLCNKSEQTFALRYAYSLPYTKSQLDVSDSNISNYLSLNTNIPEGINTTSFELNELSLLVQNPLKLTKDKNNVIKLSLDQKSIETESNVYVTVDETELNVQGVKTFVNGIKIGDSSLSQIQEDVVYLNSNLIVKGGITMYADGGDIDIPGIYDGIPIDGETLFWGTDSEGNEVLMSKSGTIKNVYVSGDGNALSSVSLTEDNTALSFLKSYTFATEGDLSRTKGELLTLIDTKADQTYVDETFVTFKKDEDIEGIKNFLNGIKINGHTVKQYDNYDDAIYIDANLIVRGGITMYADGGNIDIPNIFAALPIANTLKWIETTDDSGNVTEVLGVNPDIEFGLNEDELAAYLNEHKYATQSWVYSLKYATTTALNELSEKVNDFLEGSDTDAIINKWKELEAFLSGLSESDNLATILGTKVDKAIKISAGTGLSGGGTLEADRTLSLDTSGVTAGTYKSVTVDKYGRVTSGTNPTTLAGYGITDAYTKTKVDELLGDYVTIKTAQTITGEKNFTGGLKVNGSPIVYDATNKYWKLEGDLLVTGGVTMYGSDSEFTPSTIMDAIATDGTNLKVVNGVLTFVGSIDGGEAGSVAWENVEGKPSWIGASKPSYAWSEITGKPSFASVATSGKYADLSGTPTLLSSFTNDVGFITSYVDTKNTAGSTNTSSKIFLIGATSQAANPQTYSHDTAYVGTDGYLYSGGAKVLTSHQTIYNLTMQAGAFSAVTFDPNGANKTVNIPTTTSHITEGNNLYYTNARAQAAITGGASTIVTSNLTANRALISNASGKVAVSAVTSTELGYLDGVTSAIQTQLNSKLAATSYTAADVLAKLLTVDGASSGLDADLLDGTHKSGLLTAASSSSATNLSITVGGTTKTITDLYAYKTTQLETARTIWGQSFNGTGNVSGALSGATTGAFSSNVTIGGTLDVTGAATLKSTLSVASDTTLGGGLSVTAVINRPSLGYLSGGMLSVGLNGLYGTHIWTEGSGLGCIQVGRSDGNATSYLLAIQPLGGDTHICGNLLTYGGITMYSDKRKKTILKEVELTLQQIAEAPLIEHYYNSDEKRTTHVGSIAQYWASMNDWFCKLDNEGFYTMEIQNAALASAISIARHLQKYESKTDRTIRKLKQRVSELEEKIEKLEKKGE